MFLWFAGLAFVGVALVFSSPAVDHRLVMAGAVVPVIEWGWGPLLLHTLVFSVALMALVMLGLRGRRLAQRQWLALPIGLFAHLVLDGTWADRELFWWPLFGTDVASAGIPESTRGVGVLVAMELAGLAALIWAVRRYQLTDADRRRQFVRTGRLDRALVG
ncbi:MAG: hypothetical protein OES57_08005 [Acidimicrobiia bacterium]|nr:hypothetical protein [Acidimicrobiia bacterium]